MNTIAGSDLCVVPVTWLWINGRTSSNFSVLGSLVGAEYEFCRCFDCRNKRLAWLRELDGTEVSNKDYSALFVVLWEVMPECAESRSVPGST